MDQKNVGIFIFDGVEVLDFAGPFEVFSRTRLEPGLDSRRTDESAPFDVFTVAKSADAIEATGGLRVTPAFNFDTAPTIDILVVPGGFGTRPLLEDQATLSWIGRHESVAQITSVCTGALLLARSGLLANKRATTHWGSYDALATLDHTITVERGARVVTDGVITSAGVAAGIDMALAIVERLHGSAVANETAAYIEYPRH
ncbi:MAG: DJ-1/PfpI family protein [Gemmatimonadales bacterium]